MEAALQALLDIETTPAYLSFITATETPREPPDDPEEVVGDPPEGEGEGEDEDDDGEEDEDEE